MRSCVGKVEKEGLVFFLVFLEAIDGVVGEIVGVVTFESILEELVGEIQDEFDREESQIKILRTPNTFLISGSTPIHDIEKELGVTIENEEISTFSGLITGELGRIPKYGETLEVAGMKITIDDVDERRVIAAQVFVTRS